MTNNFLNKITKLILPTIFQKTQSENIHGESMNITFSVLENETTKFFIICLSQSSLFFRFLK